MTSMARGCAASVAPSLPPVRDAVRRTVARPCPLSCTIGSACPPPDRSDLNGVDASHAFARAGVDAAFPRCPFRRTRIWGSSAPSNGGEAGRGPDQVARASFALSNTTPRGARMRLVPRGATATRQRPRPYLAASAFAILAWLSGAVTSPICPQASTASYCHRSRRRCRTHPGAIACSLPVVATYNVGANSGLMDGVTSTWSRRRRSRHGARVASVLDDPARASAHARPRSAHAERAFQPRPHGNHYARLSPSLLAHVRKLTARHRPARHPHA